MVTWRCLNVQYPFSQLILSGAKSIEARRYPLGHRSGSIANAGEELFLIETPGARNSNGAVLDGLAIGPPPRKAQVIGTVSFDASTAYANRSAWEGDRRRHRIRETGHYDWDGTGAMHAWHVARVRRFNDPVDAGTKGQTGYATPRSLEVTIQSMNGLFLFLLFKNRPACMDLSQRRSKACYHDGGRAGLHSF